jgi:hypothetical protein
VRFGWAAVVIPLVLLMSACRDHKSVLDEGVCGGQFCDPPHRVSEEQARQAGAQSLAMWKRELRRGVRERPELRFDNLTPSELRRRLARAAKDYGFEVVAVKLHRPRQLAPEVVIRTTHYLDVAQSARVWWRAVDPKRKTKDDRTGWRFEGFYLRAEDERGTPFFILDNFWRESSGGGGMWARSERLYPFDHG